MNPLKRLLQWMIGHRLGAFERRYRYDMGYARDILEASPGALLRFHRIGGFAQYREDVPLDAWYAAKLAGTVAEDCGPCTQLVADMALEAGVSAAVVAAILRRQLLAMDTDAALAFRYAEATLAHDPIAGELRAEVLHRWGPRGLVSLAFALTSARIFPTLKYALGHGHACTRIRVGADELAVAHAA